MAVVNAAVDRKSAFRQALIALRYAVAAAVTVVVAMTAVYAFVVVARTDDLYLNVVDSYVSVDLSRPGDPKLSFTLTADNPSGRVRFYYTGIRCELKLNDSSEHPTTEAFDFPDMVVAPDSVVPVSAEANLSDPTLATNYLEKNSRRMFDANLTLTGSLTVGVYSVYNKTSVPTTYICTSVTVGDAGGSAADRWAANCDTKEDREKYDISG